VLGVLDTLSPALRLPVSFDGSWLTAGFLFSGREGLCSRPGFFPRSWTGARTFLVRDICARIPALMPQAFNKGSEALGGFGLAI
jgi:hypothetical protein